MGTTSADVPSIRPSLRGRERVTQRRMVRLCTSPERPSPKPSALGRTREHIESCGWTVAPSRPDYQFATWGSRSEVQVQLEIAQPLRLSPPTNLSNYEPTSNYLTIQLRTSRATILAACPSTQPGGASLRRRAQRVPRRPGRRFRRYVRRTGTRSMPSSVDGAPTPRRRVI